MVILASVRIHYHLKIIYFKRSIPKKIEVIKIAKLISKNILSFLNTFHVINYFINTTGLYLNINLCYFSWRNTFIFFLMLYLIQPIRMTFHKS